MDGRSSNQYKAELFETTICEELGFPTDFFVNSNSVENPDMVVADAKECAAAIKEKFSPIKSCDYCGRSTASALGDIIVNGKTVELKYINKSGGRAGTYHNGSMSYFNKQLGLRSYQEFLKEAGYYEFLDDVLSIAGIFSNSKTNSPVSTTKSSEIRHNWENEYQQIRDFEFPIRKKYVAYLASELEKDKSLAVTVLNDFLEKQTSKSVRKGIPDYLVVFYSDTKEVTFTTKEALQNLKIEQHGYEMTDVGIKFPGILFAAIGWQNGTGLTNPTIRVFLD